MTRDITRFFVESHAPDGRSTRATALHRAIMIGSIRAMPELLGRSGAHVDDLFDALRELRLFAQDHSDSLDNEMRQAIAVAQTRIVDLIREQSMREDVRAQRLNIGRQVLRGALVGLAATALVVMLFVALLGAESAVLERDQAPTAQVARP